MSNMQTTPAREYARGRELALIPLGVALNTAIGMIVHWLQLPVYLDAIGTIVVTLLVGLRAGIICGVLSALIGPLMGNPNLPWFSGSQAAIAIYTYLAARAGGFRNVPLAILSGIGLGIVAGGLSAPVVVRIFGGLSGSGASLIVAFLMKKGMGPYPAAIIAGMFTDPMDKVLQCLLTFWLLKGLPQRLLRAFNSPALERNGFVKSQGA